MIRLRFNTKDYLCNRMGSMVIITEKMAIRECEATGEVKLTLFGDMDCSHKAHCGVERCTESVRSSDWSACPHPLLKTQ
ncbi:MAG: hypothetical protein MUC33_14125 [Desulfobacterales bacterium]|jgi:hypothetical protein|nr:hypothetical protein [Desulfobacterales bacterium]